MQQPPLKDTDTMLPHYYHTAGNQTPSGSGCCTILYALSQIGEEIAPKPSFRPRVLLPSNQQS